jgi:hypothetical protein
MPGLRIQEKQGNRGKKNRETAQIRQLLLTWLQERRCSKRKPCIYP